MVERYAVIRRSLQKFLLLGESFPITLRDGFDFGFRRQSEDSYFLRRDRPQVRLLFAEPVKQNRSADFTGDRLGVQGVWFEGSFLLQHSQSFRECASALIFGNL